jgi:hypothetical protein
MFGVLILLAATARAGGLSVEGVHVVPHVQSQEMRYRREADFSLGARVEVFLRNESQETLVIPSNVDVRVRDRTPEELLQADEWAWHDLPSAWGGEPLRLQPGTLTVWSWNGKRALWGVNTQAELAVTLPDVSEADQLQVTIASPKAWLSAVTFLGAAESVQPDSLIFHVVNQSSASLQIEACRLWLPENNATWRVLSAQPWISNQLERFPANGVVPANDRGGARVVTGTLPLTYAALEVKLTDGNGTPVTVWTHQRIKREVFDICGGWVAERISTGNSLHAEPYLRTLRRMHVNAGMHQEVSGYSDTDLFDRYPLKYMNRLQPFSRYDTDDVLPRVHAVEFLGEPQYGGGRPVPPQQVWKELAPYAATRLPTSVTHSEERVWRFYAGLSDYPHYDAYRVTAPAPDAWSRYDRWSGESIRWGAPLETIGEMTRSLRELNRPRSIAYWSQGAHHGWGGRSGGRERRSPTPDELRQQAYHALASRITSLYWFNLSLRSLVAFPDLIEPITRVGREVRMLDDYYLEGDAVSHERVVTNGNPTWDLDVIAGPRGALMFALDLTYRADRDERVFKFAAPRECKFTFPLPSYIRSPAEVFRVDADGVAAVEHVVNDGQVTIRDQVSGVAIYVAAAATGVRDRIEARRRDLVAVEDAMEFHPGPDGADLDVLRRILDAGER